MYSYHDLPLTTKVTEPCSYIEVNL